LAIYWKFHDEVVRGYWKLLQCIANISNIFIGNILLQGYDIPSTQWNSGILKIAILF
jgi:hypothetical protein